MSKTPFQPVGNSVGRKSSGRTAHATRESQGHAKMSLGSPSCVGDRAGRFKGTASDLRSKAGRFSSGIPGPAGKKD